MNRTIRIVLLSLLAVIIMASPVLAYAYRASYVITESNGNAYPMLAVWEPSNNLWMANNGFMKATALDTRVETLGGSAKPHMVTDSKTLTAVPVAGDSQTNLYFTTGNIDLPSGAMNIITGYGGKITTADSPALEPGSLFSMEIAGYVDTTAGSNKNLVNKPNAVSVYADTVTTGTIKASIGQSDNALAQVIYGGSDDAIAATTTEYNVLMGGGVDANWNATESVNYQVIPTAGAITQLYVRLSANVAAGTATFTLMKNGVAQSLSVAINAGASTGSDLTNSVSFVAGDTVSLRYVTSGASGTPYAQWSTLWTSTVANESIFLLNATAVIANAVYFLPQGNGGTGIADDTYAYAPMPTAGTFKKLYVQLSADPGTAPDNYRFYLRKNAANTALTVNIIADATTGNDTANTVAVVADDLISISVVPENTPAVAPYAAIGMVFSPTVVGESVVMGGGIDNSPATGATNYGFLSGGNKGAAAWSATEATQNQLTQLTVISKLYVKLRTAPDNGAGVQSYTISVREAVGNTGLTVTVSEAATTGNDVVNTYTSANGAVTDVMVVPAGTPVATHIRWGLVSRYIGVSVSVSGITPTAGEKTITTRAALNSPQWATGNVLHFDGTNTSYVDLGAGYNSQATWWISYWFKLDNNFTIGSPNQFNVIVKADVDESLDINMNTATGTLRLYHSKVGGGAFLVNIGSTETSWTAGTWYHVIASSSAANGHRLRINNGTAVTSATIGVLPSSNNFRFGNDIPAGTDFAGYLSNIIMGTDDLTPAEETALYNGVAPGDETDYWYIDEGTGNTIYSYGSAPNNGTKGAGTAWQTSTYTTGQTGRLADFTLQVDSTRVGGNLESLGASAGVPDNANNWTFLQNNVMPYATYIKETVSGTEVLKYQPNTMIRGQEYSTGTVTVTNGSATVEGAGGATWTSNMAGSVFKSTDGLYYVVSSVTDADTLVLTAVYAGGTLGGQTYNLYSLLPDRATGDGTQNGAITWGTNPAGVDVVLSGMVSTAQPSPGITVPDVTTDILPGVGVSDWFEEPAVSGSLLTNPLRPFVTLLSDNSTLTEIQSWRLYALALILMITVATARAVRSHLIIAGIAAGASIGGAVALTIFPLWTLVFAIGAIVGGAISERSPSL